LLYAADRSQHVDQKIRPALEAGNWILCDRYVDSTVAYQGYGRSLDMELIVDLCQIATNDLMPELTILVDLPPEVGMERVVKRGSADSGAEKDRIEEEKMDFHHRVREGFLAISRQEPHRMKVVDGTKDIATIQANIQKIVAEADLFDN
jgi:dTMP kinase